MKNNKMTKDTVPEGFSVVMALVDLIPVVFFGLSAVRVGRLFQSALFVTGALICLLSGVVKVLWKLIAAVSLRNIWPMFVQMRIFMPVGFLLLLAALIAGRAAFRRVCSSRWARWGWSACASLRGGSIRATRARTGSSRASTLWRRSASISACCWCEPIVMHGIR